VLGQRGGSEQGFGARAPLQLKVLAAVRDHQLVQLLGRLVGLLGLAAPRLNALLLHGDRPTHLVQLEVQPARIAHGTAVGAAAPQGRLGRAAVGARVQPLEGARLLEAGLVRRRLAGRAPARAVVNAARIAQVEATAVAAPQRRLQVATVGTLLARVQATRHALQIASQRWVIAIRTKIQLPNSLPIILNSVIGIIN